MKNLKIESWATKLGGMLLRAEDHPVPQRTTKEKAQVDSEKRYKMDLYE